VRLSDSEIQRRAITEAKRRPSVAGWRRCVGKHRLAGLGVSLAGLSQEIPGRAASPLSGLRKHPRLPAREASAAIGLSPFFVGVIVVAIVGNAAEHWVAVYFAARDKMDISVNIAVGSGAQIALFVAPVLVLASFVIGPFPMALVFNGFELGAVFLAVIIANEVTQRGESTWYEGLQLLAIYVVLGLTFYFV
jgi:Ca2+/Na+ antiporter